MKIFEKAECENTFEKKNWSKNLLVVQEPSRSMWGVGNGQLAGVSRTLYDCKYHYVS